MLIRANVDKCFQTTTDICCFYDITILKQQNMIFIRDVPTTRFAGSGGGLMAQEIFTMMDSGV